MEGGPLQVSEVVLGQILKKLIHVPEKMQNWTLNTEIQGYNLSMLGFFVYAKNY